MSKDVGVRKGHDLAEGSAAPTQETETQRAIREQWCNGCHRPRSEWRPVCPGMQVGDWTHYHSPEYWLYREVRGNAAA